jgi:CheY-like chemotaxis protein
MSERQLEEMRILVVEDEYLIADDLREALANAGAEVVGPAPDVKSAVAMMGEQGQLSAALLDINLRGETAFELADTLIGRGVPLAFTTGYDRWAIPDRFADIPRLEKPIKAHQVVTMLRSLTA